jgi:hypothetical protein
MTAKTHGKKGEMIGKRTATIVRTIAKDGRKLVKKIVTAMPARIPAKKTGRSAVS